MTITLNSNHLEFPFHPNDFSNTIVQKVEGRTMILKNFNNDSFNLTVHFFGKKGLLDSHSEINMYKEIELKSEYESYIISLISKDLGMNEDAVFDLEFE